MNDDSCVVEINGVKYYTACNLVDYLVVDDGYLINTYGSSTTLYYEYPDYYTSGSGYPRITCPSNTKAYYRQSYNATGNTLNVSSYKVINRHTSNDFLLLIVLVGVTVLNLFKR